MSKEIIRQFKIATIGKEGKLETGMSSDNYISLEFIKKMIGSIYEFGIQKQNGKDIGCLGTPIFTGFRVERNDLFVEFYLE